MRLGKPFGTMLLGVIMVLSLFSCWKQKYTLHFDDSGFESRRTQYAAGEKVTVYYGMIATDTDYTFWLDDENVEMKQGYDEQHGYVFTFIMPDHDVTLHADSRNSMMYIPAVDVTFVNEVEKADIWILPQTEENLNTSLWGTATIAGLGAGEQAEVSVTGSYETELFILRIIDDDHAFYSVNDLLLLDGYTLVFKTENARTEAVIEILDESGNVVSSQEAFTGMFGAD